MSYKNKVLRNHYRCPIKKPTYDYNKCTALVGDVDSGGGYACVGPGGVGSSL